MHSNDLDAGIQAYEAHLRDIAAVFNDHAARVDLPITMDPSPAIAALHQGINLGRISSFWTRPDDSGIIHPEQLQTAVDCFVELLRDDKHQGHVVGAMQSGKTTTALALQWAGPILYRLTGRKANPFYLIGNQRNHEDQTNFELDRFMLYYGHVEIQVSDVRADEDPLFTRSPTLVTYRESMLRDQEAIYKVPSLEDLVYRRVGGDRTISKIVELCRRSEEQGFYPLMLIDEPQFGASDRYVGADRRKCVLAQILGRIEEALGSTPLNHWFVGFSATPFELNDLEGVWEVRQRLTESYSGFNFFNGVPISNDVEITPPVTWSLSDFAVEIGVPFLANVSLSAYDKPDTFKRFAAKVGIGGSHEEYCGDVEKALRELIYAVLERHQSDGPVGLCIRAFNNNTKMQLLMERLRLDENRIEILPYYGEMGGVSVKRAIAGRRRRDLPYLIIVTNRARMADAFPTEVRFFMDLANQSSDLNALLQGLLGRACGYNKRSTVVLSDANAQIVEAYEATQGGYVHKTSRHSVSVHGGFRRGAPAAILKLRNDMDDPVVRQFFERIDREVVATIPPGRKMKVPRAKNSGARVAPILRIAEELNLFDHLESPTVRTELFPNYVTGFKVVRRGDQVKHGRDSSRLLSYLVEENGDCRYTFRQSDGTGSTQGGGAGRARGGKDGGQWLEPTIYVEKYDPVTSEPITDERAVGSWRAFMITFPLREAMREIIPATVAYPVPTSPFDSYMQPEERQHRDAGAERRKASRGGSAS